MSTTYTANVKLAQPALGDTGWSDPAQRQLYRHPGRPDPRRRSLRHTDRSTVGQSERQGSGRQSRHTRRHASVSYAGTSSQAITLSSTKVLYLDGTTGPWNSDRRYQLPDNRPRPPGDGGRRQLDDHLDHRRPPGIQRRRHGAGRHDADARHGDRSEDRTERRHRSSASGTQRRSCSRAVRRKWRRRPTRQARSG